MEDVRIPSLKEKWHERCEKSPFANISKQMTNDAAVLAFLGYMMSISMLLFIVLIPTHWQEDSVNRYWTYGLAILLNAEIGVNWVLCQRRSSLRVVPKMSPRAGVKCPANSQTVRDQAMMLPYGWSSCITCQVDAPPRSYHCQVCEMCVLKRDHHSFITGNCVGWSNMRRFVPLCLHLTLYMSLTAYITLVYLNDTIPIMTAEGAPFYFLPIAIVMFVSGSMPVQSLFFMLIFWAALVGMCMCGCFLVYEMVLVLKGVTSYELVKRNKRYQLSPLQNFRNAFGSYGLIHFLVPLPTRLPGNGVHFETSKSYALRM